MTLTLHSVQALSSELLAIKLAEAKQANTKLALTLDQVKAMGQMGGNAVKRTVGGAGAALSAAAPMNKLMPTAVRSAGTAPSLVQKELAGAKSLL